jgi:NAD(P)-dependent dehydrogenase (short-subunit alcohol dehydrogenase family)
MQNTVSIITGAGSGIGRELALQCAAKGSSVIATDQNAATLAETQALAQAQNTPIQIALLNVAEADAILAFAEKTLPHLANRPLYLFNNAGVALLSGNFSDTTMADFEWLLSINLWGVVRMSHAFLPYMQAQNAGHIINISSIFGLIGLIQQSAYCTAKFAVKGFSDTLRAELAATNIRVTCVHPGGIKTNIASSARIGGEVTAAVQVKDARNFEKLARTTPHAAAEQILSATLAQKARVLVGFDAKFIALLVRIFPVWSTDWFRGVMEKGFRKK